MRYYQLTYLISPELNEEELKVFQEKIDSLIREEGGNLADIKEGLVKKRLAYLINKKGQAYLSTLNFYLGSEKLKNLEKKLKAENRILRYLVLTKKMPKIIEVLKIRKPREKKVELKEIEKKLEEILGEI